MKLTQLAQKPQLVRITLDDNETLDAYGEPLEFWIYDRQPLNQYVKLATAKPEDFGSIVHLINDMILDEDGNSVLAEDRILPTGIMTKVISKVVETLGK